MDGLLGHSITYRIAVGPHQGQKQVTLQTVPARVEERDDAGLAKAGGFSLHTAEWQPRRTNELSWRGCAVTSPDPRCD